MLPLIAIAASAAREEFAAVLRCTPDADRGERLFCDAVDGRRPNMDGEHVKLLETLERAELVGVAGYLSRLMPSPEPARTTDDP